MLKIRGELMSGGIEVKTENEFPFKGFATIGAYWARLKDNYPASTLRYAELFDGPNVIDCFGKRRIMPAIAD